MRAFRVLIMRPAALVSMFTAALLLSGRQAACQGGVVTEVEAEFPLYSTNPRFDIRQGRDIDPHLALTYGAMKKISATRALGLTGSLMTTGAKSGSRAEIRYGSRSVTRTEFHGSVGIEKWGIHGARNTTENARGLTASAAVSRLGLGAEARVDLLRTGERNVSALSVGARAGGKAGRAIMITAAALAVLGAIALLTGIGYSEAT